MYIDKWRNNGICGGSDDSMVLIDYFRLKNKDKYALSEIIKDANIEDLFGVRPMHESSNVNCRFWMNEEHTFHADIDIPLSLIIDLSALLLQSLVDGTVVFEDEGLSFSVTAEKRDIGILVAELEGALKEPQLYYPDFLLDEFTKMRDGITEICNELKTYC